MELKKSFYYPFVAFLIFFIALFVVLGYYNWPSWDDFAFAADSLRFNFWEFQKDFFLHEAGRLFNGFLMGLCVLFPLEATYKFWPLITIMIYAICVWIFIEKVTPPQRQEKIKFLSL